MKTLFVVTAGLFLVGCRYSEVGAIHLSVPEAIAEGRLAAITITQTLYSEDIGVEQGKTIEGTASVAASIAATLRDITASQSGNAQGGSDTGKSKTDSKVEVPEKLVVLEKEESVVDEE